MALSDQQYADLADHAYKNIDADDIKNEVDFVIKGLNREIKSS